MAEMYDDFPSEYSGGSHTYESISPLPNQHKDDGHESTADDAFRVRHSGMNELQLFLTLENNKSLSKKTNSDGEYAIPEADERFYSNDGVDADDDDVFDTNKPLPTTPTTTLLPHNNNIRVGAVSRLGHSSAIDQLKRMVNYSNKSDL